MANRTVDILVGGRFHSDHLASALLERGFDVRLLTSYPRSRFPKLPKERIHPFLVPEIGYRLALKLGANIWGEDFKMTSLGRAAARALRRGKAAETLISWSSFGLESFREAKGRKVLIRDSAHISEQLSILRREYERRGLRFPYGSLSEKRELEEYSLADEIIVISEFARRTFLERGFEPEKLKLVRLGVDTSRFTPDPEWTPGSPLRILCFGSLSFRKGIPYLLEACDALSSSEAELTLIGPREKQMDEIRKRHPRHRWLDAMPQETLAEEIKRYDVFVLPTLEDGFSLCTVQAMAAGVVPIVSDHCGAAELIDEGKNGHVIPTESVDAIVEKLRALRKDPQRLSELRAATLATATARSWKVYGEDVQTALTGSTKAS